MHIYDYDFQELKQNNINVNDRPRAVRDYKNNAPIDEELENEE